MSIVVGLDGGGTKTLMVAADRDGAVRAVFEDSGCNPFDNIHWRETLARLRERSAAVCAEAEAIGFGMPGYGEVEEASIQQDAEARLFGGRRTSVMNDVKAAFEGAFCDEPGVLLLAGTGSMVWARSSSGRDVRVGGWGYQFGDEGSAFWIGQQAVARASRAIDGRSDAMGFARALYAHIRISFDEPYGALISWYASRGHLRADIAALARFVDAMAETEPEAAAILDEASEHLARHVTAAWKAIDGRGPAVWSIAGGAFRSETLRLRVAEKVGSPFRQPRLPPVGGAIRRAALEAGWQVDEAWISRLNGALAGLS